MLPISDAPAHGDLNPRCITLRIEEKKKFHNFGLMQVFKIKMTGRPVYHSMQKRPRIPTMGLANAESIYWS